MADTETQEQDQTPHGGPGQGRPTAEAHHPGVGEYVEIGVILAVLTGLEVALFYADLGQQFTIPALIVLTISKFVLVVLWFMHLRFDAKLFRRLLLGGLVLAAAIFAVTSVLVV